MFKMEKLYLILGNFSILLQYLVLNFNVFLFNYFFYSGTSYEVWGNCNAPKAITLSALIYCLRSMIGYDIPLNQVIFIFTILKTVIFISYYFSRVV